MPQAQSSAADEIAQRLREATAKLRSGDFDAATHLLSDSLWDSLEAYFWNASHPMPKHALAALDAYLHIAKSLWHKVGLGQAHPIALYKTTLLSSKAIETALRVLARIYAGCNLGYRAPPPGFWRTVYALTGYVISERFTDKAARVSLTNQTLQIWLMAWLNPLSLAPGRLPVAVRLVGILSKTCSYTMASPTHAGSGLAAADLMSDAPPMPFARVPAMWEPVAPLYVNAQDAAFTIRELATPPTRSAPSDVYDSLLQSALQVGLTVQEMQDFVRRAMREFGYSNARTIPRVGRADRVTVVAGFIETWGAVQSQNRTPVSAAPAYSMHQATVVNHSDGGFLLKFELKQPLLCVSSIVSLRGNEAEPWTIAVVRWLEEADTIVMAGCEVICNFAEARVGQSTSSNEHLPFLSYLKNEMVEVITPYGNADATGGVTQLLVDDRCWVIANPAEMGEDWQVSGVLDMT